MIEPPTPPPVITRRRSAFPERLIAPEDLPGRLRDRGRCCHLAHMDRDAGADFRGKGREGEPELAFVPLFVIAP